MAKGCKKLWKFLVGLGFVACGASKIAGINAQEKRFADIQCSQTTMKFLGGVEVVGASLLLCKKTSKLGALLLTASALWLAVTEFRKGKKQKAAIGGVGVVAALSLFRKCRS